LVEKVSYVLECGTTCVRMISEVLAPLVIVLVQAPLMTYLKVCLILNSNSWKIVKSNPVFCPCVWIVPRAL